MIALTGQLICTTEEEVATVRRFLPDHIRLTLAETGCLSFSVTETADPMVWQVEERFTDRAAFDAHQTRTKTSPWFAATGRIARRYQITELPPDPEQRTGVPTPPPRPE